ncbi:MAG: hypothetical protein SF029_07345 [bacterium]|nr:hypothetical protein [bacterium]
MVSGKRFVFGLLVMALIALAGCSRPSVTDVATAVADAAEADETAAPNTSAGSEESAEATVILTPEATSEITYFATDQYSVVVSYTIEDEASFPAGTPDAPEGQRWIFVLAAINNVGGEPVEITAESLVLIDALGNRYTAEDDDAIMPPLVGQTVEQDSSVYGLARFAVPPEAQAAILEWCPLEACEQPLRAPIS